MTAQYAFEKDWENPIPKTASGHLTNVTKKSHEPKTTDIEPISVIINKLKNLNHIDAVDVGCGAGRYDMLLYRYLGDKLTLTCLDANEDTLKNLVTYFNRHGVKTFSSKKSTDETLPFASDTMDCIFIFNTLHNLNLPCFLSESARIIRHGGYLFIYTRIQPQGGSNPMDDGLVHDGVIKSSVYTMDTLKQALDAVGSLSVESIVFFAYNRMAALEQLFFRDRSRRYATFTPYSPQELEQALKAFSIKIHDDSKDMQSIRWFDDNVLFIIEKAQKTSVDYLKINTNYGGPGMVV